jgi:capsular exopolysaccharide synthesis family protein
MRNIEKGLAKARAHSASLHSVGQSAVAPDFAAASVATALEIDSLACVHMDPRILAKNRVVVDELSAASAAYKMLRTRVLQRMRRNNWKTIAVTGTCPEEGKSLTAINLSINLARDVGTTVMLVDMDLRKPSIHRHLGISAQYGIGDLLRGSAALQSVAVRPGIDRLGVILNERPFSNSSEMLASPQTANLVEQVKQGDSRIVVFDLPPVLASDDMLAFCPMVDAVLLVLAQGKTKHADMVAARELLQNANIVGAVLNRSSDKVAPYYYYGQR